MKPIFIFLTCCSFVFFSCKNSEVKQDQGEVAGHDHNTHIPADIHDHDHGHDHGHIHNGDHGHEEGAEEAEGDGPKWEDFSLPADFTMDSTSLEISELLATKEMQIPQSGNKEIDEIVNKRVDEQWNSFKKGLDDYVKESVNSYFWVFPEFLYQNDRFISYLFYKSTMHMGHAHPMHEYFSVNIDKKTLKEIEFQDVFQVQSKADSAAFLALVNGHIDEHAEVGSVYEYTFNLGKDFVLFSYDAYEAGAYAIGAPRSMVPTKKVVPYLKPAFAGM